MAESDKKKGILVAAIDFGTTFSGFAYQFRSTYDSERTKIFANQTWEGDQQRSQKTVTCILFDKNLQFDSFGYEAERRYFTYARKGEHNDWYCFRRFKMKLYNSKEKITRDIKIKAENGKEMRAMTVFGESIKYLKTILLKQLETRNAQVETSRIHWVLTVPAIWSDSAKQFMRESANEAGIDGGRLTIALEPEAASLYCQLLNEEQVTQQQAIDERNIAVAGQKFMVVDLGGGTADITVHKREANGATKELCSPGGGCFGGTRVDQAFESLLNSLVGAPVMKEFSAKYPYDHFQLMSNYERSKRSFTKSTDEIVITVPIKIDRIYREQNSDECVEDAVKQSPYSDKVEWADDKLILNSEMMTQHFNSCALELIKHIEKLMVKDEVQETDIIIMAGGFSESEFMQNAVKEAFPSIKVVIPPDPGLAVVKGAVLYGHYPKSVSSRRSRYTYGINISPTFDQTRHKPDHQVHVGGIDRCRDVFKKYIQKGELINTGEPRTGMHITLKPNQDEMLLKLYVSERVDPQYVDEEGCEFVGNIVVQLPMKKEKIKVEVRMMFGDTEVTVEAEEKETNTKYKAYFDFL